MRLPDFLLLSASVWLVGGCTDAPAPATSATPPTTPVTTTPVSETVTQPAPESEATRTAPQTVELQLLEWDGIEQLIASHRGQIVVVDLWATYCAPCRKEFPGLIELSQAHPDDVACISVSLDDVADQEEALEFLQEQNATIANVLCTTDADTVYDEILKIGAIPAVYVYGRDGEMLRRFTGPAEDGDHFTYERHITPFVQQLLDQG